MRIGTLFSGIGAPEQGAKRVYDDLEMVFACEFDKFARESFQANYKIAEDHFHIDVNDMDGTQYKDKVDIIIGGSPCQAFSIAGLREGLNDKRGQLIWQYYRIIMEAQPEIFIYENVKGMVSDNNGKTLKDFLDVFRESGYFCHHAVLNTKDYGVPQNRERVYIVGFKDHELYHRFQFAPKIKLEKRLKDVLESEVDEKYYLSDTAIKGFISHRERMEAKGNGFKFEPTDGNCVASSLTTRAGSRPDDNFIKIEGMLNCKGTEQIRRVDGVDGVAATLTTMQGGNQEPKIVELRVDEGIRYFKDNVCGTLRTTSECGDKHVIEPRLAIGEIRGRNPQNPKSRQSGLDTEQILELNKNGTSNCLTTVQKDNVVVEPMVYDDYNSKLKHDGVACTLTINCGASARRSGQKVVLPDEEKYYRIRKLTPRECLRLQDFPDTFTQVVSNSQQYKQAGNSMSVNILEMIFRQIEKAKENEPTNTLMDFIS